MSNTDNIRMTRHVYLISDYEIYVGSAIDVDYRMVGHRSPSNNCTSKPIIERNNYNVEIILTVENVTDAEIKQFENYYFLTKKCVNKNRPYIYDCERKGIEKIQNKKFYDNNKFKHWSAPLTCSICNTTFRKDGLARHNKSKKHKKNILILA